MKVVSLYMVFFCLFLSHNSWASQQQAPVDGKEAKVPSPGTGKNVTWQRLAVLRPTWFGTHVKEARQYNALLHGYIPKKWTEDGGTYTEDETIEVNGKKVIAQATKPLKTTPLHVAISYGDAEWINELIEKDPSLIDSVDIKGRRPVVMLILGYSTKAWARHVLAKMFQKRPYLVDSTIPVGKFKYTLLQWAAYHGRVALCHLLIKHGARVNVTDEVSACTPLHFACAQGDALTFEVLMAAKNLNVNAVDCDGATPLHYLAGKPWYDGTCALKNPLDSRAITATALYEAQCKVRKNMITRLVKAGAFPFAEDKSDQRPSGYASDGGHDLLVDQLSQLETDILTTIIKNSQKKGELG